MVNTMESLLKSPKIKPVLSNQHLPNEALVPEKSKEIVYKRPCEREEITNHQGIRRPEESVSG